MCVSQLKPKKKKYINLYWNVQSSLDYKWQKWRKFVSTKVSDITLTLLYMSQPALLYVTAETLVNRLMWQISTATLLLNPVILHQRGMKFFFSAIVKMERWKARKNEGEIGKDGQVVWKVMWASARIHIKTGMHIKHGNIFNTVFTNYTFSRTWQKKKKNVVISHPSLLSLFFLTQAHGLRHTASLCTCLLLPNTVLNPISLWQEL